MIDRQRAKRLVRAYLRDTQVLIKQFRFTLLFFFALLLLGTLILRLTYAPTDPAQIDGVSGRLRWGTALHAVFKLMFFETLLEHPRHLLAQFVFLSWPVLGLVLLVNGVVSFGTALFSHKQREEAWQVAVASTYRNHVVICGLGRVGYRVALQLLKMQQEVVGVESDPQAPFLDRIREEGVPVLIGDARNREILEQAGVPVASAVVACTEDDLTNLEIALDARDLAPTIKVVMRMFDQRLAERIRKGFGIRTAFSTSALAAPALAAAATRAAVEYSFYVDDVLLNVSSVTLAPGTPLVGRKVKDVERELNISIILCQGEDGVDLHPEADRLLSPGDQIVVFATLEALAVLNRLNQEGRDGDIAVPRKRPKSGKLGGWLDRLRRKSA
jgi:Trk K+ transport system NAD-binding subunit